LARRPGSEVDPEAYEGREATFVKHFFLAHYLQHVAYKVGSVWPKITYVDGFAGPWKSKAEDLSDTSPHIAVAELRQASEKLASMGRHRRFRCIFVEKSKAAANELRASLGKTAPIECEVLQGAFEDRIPDILRAVGDDRDEFVFTFIDPTGWTGFGMEAITPLLRRNPGEVLINLMTKDVKRFIDETEGSSRESFERLFGVVGIQDVWAGRRGIDREDTIVATYAETVQAAGDLSYAASTVVIHPTQDRTHFHLVFATRNAPGLIAFRDVEKRTMREQEDIREEALRQNRAPGQESLFAARETGPSKYYSELRDRYLANAKTAVANEIRTRRAMPYDKLELFALLYPMTWDTDVSGWVQEWGKTGRIRIEGLGPKERTPKRGKRHSVVWTGL
jgi:three-Cys-motif partner protein